MKMKMKKIFKLFLIISTFLIFLYSCQSVKDGLTLKKRNNGDEFLVEKKNPLATPPKFDELPKPKTTKQADTIENLSEISLEDKIKKKITQKKSSKDNQEINKSLEESILEKIKNN